MWDLRPEEERWQTARTRRLDIGHAAGTGERGHALAHTHVETVRAIAKAYATLVASFAGSRNSCARCAFAVLQKSYFQLTLRVLHSSICLKDGRLLSNIAS